MAIMQATPGVQNNGDTQPVGLRAGKQGELIISRLHGAHYEQTYRGNIFSISNQAAVTTTAGLATTFTGLSLGNPIGSGVNLAILRFKVGQAAVGAAAAVGIMGGVGTITASLTPQSRILGSGQVPKATATAGQTISTPVLIGSMAGVGSLATTGYGLQLGVDDNIDGCLIVPPGSFIASYTSGVTTSSLIFGFLWEEIPV